MKRLQRILQFASVLGAIVIMIGCAYEAAVQRLPPPEREAFRAYSRVMTAGQARTYLAKETAAERATYLVAIGIAQRFQALDSQDREAVLSGYIRKGMSADALRFLWGEPYYTKGYSGHYESWLYLGSSLDLATYSSSAAHSGGTKVEVYLVAGRVKDWLEYVEPHDEPGPNDNDRRSR